MDVNGTRFHLLLGETDWQGALRTPVDPDLSWSAKRSSLTLQPEQFKFPPRTGDVRLGAGHRRGAACDRYGNWYSIGPDRTEIRILAVGDAGELRYGPALAAAGEARGDFAPSAPVATVPATYAGLAVTDDQYLVVGATGLPPVPGAGSAGLVVFDVHGGGPPEVVRWPDELGFNPIDIAALPGGGVAILDLADRAAPGPARFWVLDRLLRVRDLGGAGDAPAPTPDFAPSDGDPPPAAVTGIPSQVAASAAQAAPVAARWATAIEALPDGSVLVLDRESAAGRFDVERYVDGVQVDFDLGIAGSDDPEHPFADFAFLLTARGHDMAFVANSGSAGQVDGRLLVVDEQGDQAFSFLLADDRVEPERAYYPLRLFGGKALATCGDTAYYDLAERWYPVVARARPRYAERAVGEIAPEAGAGAAAALDGQQPGTVWHRLFLDAAIPPGTGVTVESRAADDPAVLERRPWQAEPPLYLRGSGAEIPYHRFGGPAPGPGEGTWELLFQQAVGRYLQIRLTLHGDGRHTPRIWALRAYYPRFSYLDRYLPDVYAEDAESASFLDRYLANVEGLYTAFEGRVAAAQWLLDPDTTDPDYLEWLASWVGGVLDPDWEEERRRLFVRHAARLFTRRGTRRGLLEAIRLVTDECPTDAIFADDADTPFGVRIVESFRTREAAGVVFGDPTDLIGPGLTSSGDLWELADGRAQFRSAYQAFLAGRYGTDSTGQPDAAAVAAAWGVAPGPTLLTFPPLTPTVPAKATDWRDFTRTRLAVTYAEVGSPADLTAYRRFLAQRYRLIDAYNTAWRLQGTSRRTSFDAVEFPTKLPADGVPLQDWIQFVSAVLPIRRQAHRFSVLVPIRVADSDAARELRLGRVTRVVEADRPGHTAFEVKPYWAAFRVGEARVGFETVLGESSRYVRIAVGIDRLAAGYLPGARWDVAGRLVVGRERITASEAAPAASEGNGDSNE